jgi:hypothetical protein
VVVVPGLGFTAIRSIGVVRSQRASERESRLLGGLLGLAAQATGEDHLVATPQLVRLSQARVHLCACEFFVHEIHGGAPVLVGLHGGGVILRSGRGAELGSAR